MKPLVLITTALAAVLAGPAMAQDSLPRALPACVLLDPVVCDQLQPVPNWQADNLDTQLTGYGWPWVNLRQVDPDNPGWTRIEQLRWPRGYEEVR